MKKEFITSYLTFYMKATVELAGDFIKVANPNSILKVIFRLYNSLNTFTTFI